MFIKKLTIPVALTAALCFGINNRSNAETVYIEPLFEYVTAPDTMQNLQPRANYVVTNFWNPMDFKSKNPVSQAALNHAFDVYIETVRLAEADIAFKSIDNLLKKSSKNETLLMQLVKSAEEKLYGPRADYFIDDIYIRFLEALMKNKKINDLRKVRYADQLKKLKASHIGQIAPEFKFKDRTGEEKKYYPMSTFTIIEFGDPTCTDCRQAKFAFDVNWEIEDLIKSGKLNILFIIPDDPDSNEDWKTDVADYPENWAVGASGEVDEIYDLRLTPAIYLIDNNGKIVAKNISATDAINLTLANFKQ